MTTKMRQSNHGWPEVSVTILDGGTDSRVIDHVCDELARANVAVHIVSRWPHASGLSCVTNFVAGSEESLWELIPPCSLVVCSDPEQESDVQAHTGFPYMTVQELEHSGRVILDALQKFRNARSTFRGPSLSVCMIAKNEERNIERALRSICGVASEIILVDTGSTDATVEIALRYGARVFPFAWEDDFSAARNESLAHASGDWILILDADEAMSSEFRRNSLGRLIESEGVEAFSQPLVNIVSERIQDQVSVLRLFRNREAYRFEGRVHEQVYQSIERAGGKIGKETSAILHYGYSSRETARKGRRQRNRRLLEQAHQEDPKRVDYWHYLGHEALAMQDLCAAESWLSKVINEAPTSPFVAFSAPLLARTLIGLGKLGDAWSAVNLGLSTRRGRGNSLSVLGDLALQEGDFATAEWGAQQLRLLPTDAEGLADPDRSAAQLLAGSLMEQGRRREALKASEKLFRSNPDDMALAFWYVKMGERAEGVRFATVETIRRYGTVAVKAAAIGPLVRIGEWDLARNLAESTGDHIQSLYHLAAFLRAGMDEAAVRMADRMGVEGSILMLLWAMERDDATAVDAALAQDIPESHRDVVRHFRDGTPASASLAWVPVLWMRLAAELRMDELSIRLSRLLPGGKSSQAAMRARILYETGRKQEALSLAIQAPTEPDGLQVLGLAAYENRDWEAAATFLQARAAFGDAPVRVYWNGAVSLQKLGRSKEAQAVLEQGRKARPLSLLLARGI